MQRRRAALLIFCLLLILWPALLPALAEVRQETVHTHHAPVDIVCPEHAPRHDALCLIDEHHHACPCLSDQPWFPPLTTAIAGVLEPRPPRLWTTETPHAGMGDDIFIPPEGES